MGTKLDLLQQLTGQGKNILSRSQHLIHCDAAGDLLKILKLHFQREGMASKLVFRDAPFQFFNRVYQLLISC